MVRRGVYLGAETHEFTMSTVVHAARGRMDGTEKNAQKYCKLEVAAKPLFIIGATHEEREVHCQRHPLNARPTERTSSRYSTSREKVTLILPVEKKR